MAIMKGLQRVLKSFKYSEINQLAKAGFFTSGVKIKSKSLKSQRKTSVVEQEKTKKPPIWEVFFVSKPEYALSAVMVNKGAEWSYSQKRKWLVLLLAPKNLKRLLLNKHLR